MVSLINGHLHTYINQSILKLAKKKKKKERKERKKKEKKNVASNHWIGRPMLF